MTNNRYKPLYKNFLLLKQNVQNRQKLYTFRKKKWQKFIQLAKRNSNKRPLNKLYDQTKLLLPVYSSFFKQKFRYNLYLKKKISLFYGGLLKKSFKKIIISANSNSKKSKGNKPPQILLLQQLEGRLDVIIQRSFLMPSIRNVRLFIKHKQVIVNGRFVTNKKFQLKKGDLIEIVSSRRAFINKSIQKSVAYTGYWPLPPKNMQINYRTLQAICVKDLTTVNSSAQFLFWLDLNSTCNFCKY